MKGVFITLFGLIALYDVFTTVTGTNSLVENFIISIFFGIVVLTLLLMSSRLFENEFEGTNIVLGICWLSALLYDFYTSFVGNELYLFTGNAEEGGQLFILVLITIITTGSPIILSSLIFSDL